MPVFKTPEKFITEAIASVKMQTYPHWELICVDDGSQDKKLTEILKYQEYQDSRIKIITLPHNKGISEATNTALNHASGEYILFMDHDDYLEPHALMRFSDAAMLEKSDLIYGDEVTTSEDINNIISVKARPIFSYDHYISHPYIVHPIAVKTRLAKEIDGLDTKLKISQDIDFILRIIEKSKKSHTYRIFFIDGVVLLKVPEIDINPML